MKAFVIIFLIAQRRSVSSLYEIKNQNAQVIFESSNSYSIMLKTKKHKTWKAREETGENKTRSIENTEFKVVNVNMF